MGEGEGLLFAGTEGEERVGLGGEAKRRRKKKRISREREM